MLSKLFYLNQALAGGGNDHAHAPAINFSSGQLLGIFAIVVITGVVLFFLGRKNK